MKRLLALALLVFVATAHAETITTLRGKKFYSCHVKQVHPDGISFTHKSGAAKILFTDLPRTVREQYGYSATKAAAYTKKIVAARQAAEKQRQENAVREAEEAEKAEFDALVNQLHEHSAQMLALAEMQQQPTAGWRQIYAVTASPNGWAVPPPIHGPVLDCKPYTRPLRSWDNVGLAPLVPGVGGVYVPPSGGHVFYPGITPSLGYARPGYGVSATVRAGSVTGNVHIGGMRGNIIGRR